MAAQKLTVGDVLAAGHTVGTAGKGKTPHVVTAVPEFEGRTVTLCTKTAASIEDFSHTPDTAVCINCARKFPTITEGSDMPTNSKAPETTADDKAPEAEGFPTNGETTERVKRDAAAKAAAEKAAKDAEGGKGAEVAVPAEPSAPASDKTYDDKPEVLGLVGLATSEAKAYKDASGKARGATARIAALVIDARRRLSHNGMPDLMGDSAAAKKVTRDMLRNAGLIKNKPVDGIRDEITETTIKFESALRNAVGDARVIYLRNIEEEGPESEELAFYGELKSVAAIREHFGIVNETLTEKQRRLNLEKTAAKKELEAKKSEADTAETAAADVVETATTAAPGIKPVAVLAKMLPVLPGLLDYISTLEGAEIVELMGQMDALEDFITKAKAIYAPVGDDE